LSVAAESNLVGRLEVSIQESHGRQATPTIPTRHEPGSGRNSAAPEGPSHAENLAQDFQRNAKAYLERIRRSGRPIVLTVNGKAAAVVHDAAGYQKLLDAIDRAEALEGIRRGLVLMKRGEGRLLQDALEDLGRKYEGTGMRKNGVGGACGTRSSSSPWLRLSLNRPTATSGGTRRIVPFAGGTVAAGAKTAQPVRRSRVEGS
jgi:prevent-host-death family protein